MRHHFYRVAQYAKLLGATDLSKEERVMAAWEFWEQGLIGHVLRRDHSHCAEGAECRAADYKPRPELNSLATTIFKNLVSNPKMRALVAMCIFNGHTWDCESLSNLCHMYQVYTLSEATTTSPGPYTTTSPGPDTHQPWHLCPCGRLSASCSSAGKSFRCSVASSTRTRIVSHT